MQPNIRVRAAPGPPRKSALASALILVFATVAARAAPLDAGPAASPGAFPIISPGVSIPLLVDAKDDPGVLRAADDLRADIGKVGGTRGVAAKAWPKRAGAIVIAGTLGRSRFIDRLVKKGKLDVSVLAGQWEGYVEQVVDHPRPGIDRALVIAGSDRRGTIFGLYDISGRIGVSPWSYWADVPAQRHDHLFLAAGRIADHPVVKYRGIFLNDEAPALTDWATKTFGGLNHKFYETLFTLILRSKANFLWPAMWGKSLWDDDPLSAPLAKRMGIVLGTSHHEPMERANIEWKRYGDGGAWDYTTNAPALREFWRKGIERRSNPEDLITIGMRGDGDEPMTQGTAIGLLEKIVADQRTIIADVTRRPADQTPQVWALYKEVQDYYDKGMRVPDDVTLLFSDDNWGDLRRLPAPGSKRAGGYGIYYHFDYVGGPRNYKWIDTNSIERTWQQMETAHAYGADRLWVVNVGDLKPMEFATSFFLDLAWNPDRMTPAALAAYPAKWAATQFGPGQARAIGDLLDRYGQLAARRKPELLDADTYDLASGEWARVMDEWTALLGDARRIEASVPADRRDAYYELVLHRIEANENLHALYFTVAEERRHAAEGRSDTAALASEARRLFANDAAIRRRYEASADGKWPDMMAQTHIGYTSWQEPPADVMPALAPAATTQAAVADNAARSNARPPSPPRGAEFVGEDDRIVIDAAHAAEIGNGGGFIWRAIPRLGQTAAAMIATPVATAAIEHPGGSSPHLTYRFTLAKAAPTDVSVLVSPGLDVRGTGKQRYAISLDDGAPIIVDTLAGETEKSWGEAVSNAIRRGRTQVNSVKAGAHRLTLWLVDPQLVFQRVEIAPAGARPFDRLPLESCIAPDSQLAGLTQPPRTCG